MGNQDVEMERGTKRPASIEKHPVMLLQEISPSTKFELVSESGEPHAKVYVMKALVNGSVFKGSGRSKKLAKTEVAKAVLLNMGIPSKFDEEGNVVCCAANKKQRAQINKVKHEVADQEEKPITLSTLYGDSVKYDVLSQEPGNNRVTLRIEGTLIEGFGASQKAAKEMAREKGMTFLREMGLYDKRVREFQQRQEVKRMKKIEYFRQKRLEKASAKNITDDVKPSNPTPQLQAKAPAPTPQPQPMQTNQQTNFNQRRKKDKGTKL